MATILSDDGRADEQASVPPEGVKQLLRYVRRSKLANPPSQSLRPT